ncbi:TonB-dependent receptor [candidate division KSB1 bacterium]|nr:TonB-dependent receptor [candidate division KSB1 bacterium]
MVKKQFLIVSISLLVGILTIQTANAQPEIPVSGIVRDKSSGQPLGGANIVVEGSNRGATSDNNGNYQLKLPAGDYIISASFMGYSIAKKRVAVKSVPLDLDFEMTPIILEGQEVIVTATRARERETPVVFTDIPGAEIREKYWSQDIPMLLSDIPGVYATSDAGNGIGYTYLKIRGFDQKRVSVMLNGIPLNDPEDHQVYWVDMPDFISSVQDIQIQRGVGSSLYGTSSFGGTVNVITHEHLTPQKISLMTGAGSYNTRKFTLNLQSGLINNRYSVAARFSKITSDGYRDNSASDLWAYFLSAARYDLNSTLKLNVYGGPELTHAAWEASPESELKKNHKHNPYTYSNSVDNFHQPHYELHHEWALTENLTLLNSLYYIHGKGYYEIFKSDSKLVDYGYQSFYLPDSSLVKRTDIVRQKWVEKDHAGWIARLDWQHSTRGMLSIGGDAYTFWSDHWGKVRWASQLPPGANADHTYYQYSGHKKLGTVFVHELYKITPALSAMADLNLQFQTYSFEQKPVGNFKGADRHAFDVTYAFVNPRVGVNYNLSERMNIFGNVSMSHREPSDDDLFDVWQGPDDLGVAPLFRHAEIMYTANGQVDYIKWRDPLTKPERLIDYEFGIGYRSPIIQTKLNAYIMDFRDEIVPFSQVDKDGMPIKGNAERTIHRGVEALLNVKPKNWLGVNTSLTLSQNYFAEFKQLDPIYDAEWNLTGTKATDLSGNPIAGFPAFMASGRITTTFGVFNSSFQLQHIGKQYLDNTGSESRIIAAYTLLNATVAFKIPPIAGFEDLRFSLWVNNLLDVTYETAGYWYEEKYLMPGADRNFFVNLEMSL